LWLTARHGKAGVAEAVDAMTSHARGGPMADDERETVISECAYEYYLHMNMTKDVNQGRSKCSSEFLALPTTKAREALFHLSCLAKLPADSQIYESAVSWIEELAAALNIDPSDEGYAVVYLLLRTQARAASTKHRHAPARRADGAVDAIPFAQAVCAPLRKSPMDWKGGKQALINSQLRAQQIERNRQIAMRNLDREKITGSLERAENRVRGREFRGAQLVQQLQSGAETGSGTSLRVRVQTANQIALEINKQSWANEERQLALRMQADGFESQRDLEIYSGRSQNKLAQQSAKMSLLTGAAKTAGAYYGNA
jgi:hypothetical protein